MTSGLLPAHLGLPTLPPIACLPFQTTMSALADTDGLPPARVPIIPKLFAYGCPTRAPGDSRKLHSVLSALLQAPLPEHMKKKRAAEQKRLLGEYPQAERH
jgi:RNA exonuclease 1